MIGFHLKLLKIIRHELTDCGCSMARTLPSYSSDDYENECETQVPVLHHYVSVSNLKQTFVILGMFFERAIFNPSSVVV